MDTLLDYVLDWDVRISPDPTVVLRVIELVDNVVGLVRDPVASGDVLSLLPSVRTGGGALRGGTELGVGLTTVPFAWTGAGSTPGE